MGVQLIQYNVWGGAFVISGTEVLAIIGMYYEVSLMILTMNDADSDFYSKGVSY